MGTVTLNGATSGSITVAPPAVAGTNTLTLPAATGTLIYGTQPSGSIVGTTATQTLTNKTLTSPTINSPTINTPTMGGSVITSGTAVASTSGTAILFTSIPSWAKRITVMLNGVTMSAGNMIVQIGSGSLTTSGYTGGVVSSGSSTTTQTSFTAGFGVFDTTPTVHSGMVIITNISGNIWVAQAVAGNSTRCGYGGGNVTLSGTLDRVNITTVAGTATFSAGSINIFWE